MYHSHLLTRAARSLVHRRCNSTSSFSELFRKSIDSAPVSSGDVLRGHVVGAFRPGSTSSRFYLVDFGLKEEAIFTPKELPQNTVIGDSLALPLVQLEDDFNEPSFDHSQQSQLSSLQAERYQLLTGLTSPSTKSPSHSSTSKETDKDSARIVYGRFTRFNRGGATVKILGVDAFVPRHHLLALERPVLGTFAPFYLLSMNVTKPEADNTHLDIFPVVSSYGGILLCLANLVAFDAAWKASGGGSSKARLSYLRLLTRILQQKNPAVRRMIPSSTHRSFLPEESMRRKAEYDDNLAQRSKYQKNEDSMHHGMRMRRKSVRNQSPASETAWLNDLPTGSWASSKKRSRSSNIGGATTAIHNILRRKPQRDTNGESTKPDGGGNGNDR